MVGAVAAQHKRRAGRPVLSCILTVECSIGDGWKAGESGTNVPVDGNGRNRNGSSAEGVLDRRGHGRRRGSRVYTACRGRSLQLDMCLPGQGDQGGRGRLFRSSVPDPSGAGSRWLTALLLWSKCQCLSGKHGDGEKSRIDSLQGEGGAISQETDLVDIFDDGVDVVPVFVHMQQEFWEEWLASLPS